MSGVCYVCIFGLLIVFVVENNDWKYWIKIMGVVLIIEDEEKEMKC